jgi:hypothetical protein
MVYRVQLELRGLLDLGDRAAERCIEAALDALAIIDLEYLQAHPNTPRLYDSGVRYRDDTADRVDRWLDIPSVLQRGFGDCDDLVPWRIAELWRDNIHNARSVAHLQRMQNGDVIFHATVRAGLDVEDPSANLGMRT